MKLFLVLACALGLGLTMDVYGHGMNEYSDGSSFLSRLNSGATFDGHDVFKDINRIAVHLGYQEGDYNSSLKAKLLSDIGAGGLGTINIAKLTNFGLGPEIVELLTSPDSAFNEQRQYAKFLFVVEESHLQDMGIQLMLKKLSATEPEGLKTYSVIVLKSLDWKTFATDLALRVAALKQLSMDIFLNEGGLVARNIVLSLITHSRYRRDLNRYNIHLGLNHLPKNIVSVDGHLAATEIASQMKEILMLNRYADFEMSFHSEPDIYTIATVDEMDRVNPLDKKVTQGSDKVQEHLSNLQYGKNHVNNLAKINLIDGDNPADQTNLYVSSRDGVITMIMDMTASIYNNRYLRGMFVVAMDLGQHQIPQEFIQWKDLESMKFTDRKLVIAEIDLTTDDRYSDLVDTERLDILLSPLLRIQLATGQVVHSNSLEPKNVTLYNKIEMQKENFPLISSQLKEVEYRALSQAFDMYKTRAHSGLIDLKVKPKNIQVGSKFRLSYYAEEREGVKQLKTYKDLLKEERALAWITSQGGCSGLFGNAKG